MKAVVRKHHYAKKTKYKNLQRKTGFSGTPRLVLELCGNEVYVH